MLQVTQEKNKKGFWQRNINLMIFSFGIESTYTFQGNGTAQSTGLYGAACSCVNWEKAVCQYLCLSTVNLSHQSGERIVVSHGPCSQIFHLITSFCIFRSSSSSSSCSSRRSQMQQAWARCRNKSSYARARLYSQETCFTRQLLWQKNKFKPTEDASLSGLQLRSCGGACAAIPRLIQPMTYRL